MRKQHVFEKRQTMLEGLWHKIEIRKIIRNGSTNAIVVHSNFFSDSSFNVLYFEGGLIRIVQINKIYIICHFFPVLLNMIKFHKQNKHLARSFQCKYQSVSCVAVNCR